MCKESFVSIMWRLIPYWLNNWEQQWGAECSSMMFELPHFAMELLVILPCVQVGRHPHAHLHAALRACKCASVLRATMLSSPCLQIICSRMKILAMPIVNMAVPAIPDEPAPLREHFAPNILKGFWEHHPAQRRMMPRLK